MCPLEFVDIGPLFPTKAIEFLDEGPLRSASRNYGKPQKGAVD